MLRRLISIAICSLFAASVQAAGDFGTRDEAVAMVKRVEAKFAKDGADPTFKAITAKAPEFHDRDLYPFVVDINGINVAHGANPALIGKDLSGIKDPDGRFPIREMLEKAKAEGKGWIDYKWPNPSTNKIDDKSSYFERLGDYVVGVGVYR